MAIFVKGNTKGRGDPNNRRVRQLRQVLLRKAQKGDLEQIYDMLLYKALNEQDVVAAKELLDRLLGKATQPLSDPDGDPLRTQQITIDLSQLNDSELQAVRHLAKKAAGQSEAPLLEQQPVILEPASPTTHSGAPLPVEDIIDEADNTDTPTVPLGIRPLS